MEFLMQRSTESSQGGPLDFETSSANVNLQKGYLQSEEANSIEELPMLHA